MERTLPTWLDGQTIAIIGTVLTVGIGIGAMVLASTSAMRAETDRLHVRIDDVQRELTAKIEDVRKELTAKIEDVRKELGAQIAGLDARVRVVEQSMEATRGGVPDLQARVRALETHARQPAKAAHPPSPDAGGAERRGTTARYGWGQRGLVLLLACSPVSRRTPDCAASPPDIVR